MYKMSYITDIVNFLGGRLLERGVYFEILLFGGAFIRSFTVSEFTRPLTSIESRFAC